MNSFHSALFSGVMQVYGSQHASMERQYHVK